MAPQQGGTHRADWGAPVFARIKVIVNGLRTASASSNTESRRSAASCAAPLPLPLAANTSVAQSDGRRRRQCSERGPHRAAPALNLAWVVRLLKGPGGDALVLAWLLRI